MQQQPPGETRNEPSGSAGTESPLLPAEREVAARLAQMERCRKGRKRWLRLFFGSSLVNSCLLLLYALGDANGLPILLSALSLLFTGVSLAFVLYNQARVSEELAWLEAADVRAVGAFIEALDYSNFYREAEAVLIELLPRMQAHDAPLLKEKHRNSLYRALSGCNTALIIAILKAFEQVGDSEAIPYAEVLAGDTTLTSLSPLLSLHILRANRSTEVRPAADNRSIRAAAQACLRRLYLRAEQECLSQTLLRPAGPADVLPDVLLRPASEGSPVDPRLLLRPDRPEGSC